MQKFLCPKSHFSPKVPQKYALLKRRNRESDLLNVRSSLHPFYRKQEMIVSSPLSALSILQKFKSAFAEPVDGVDDKIPWLDWEIGEGGNIVLACCSLCKSKKKLWQLDICEEDLENNAKYRNDLRQKMKRHGDTDSHSNRMHRLISLRRSEPIEDSDVGQLFQKQQEVNDRKLLETAKLHTKGALYAAISKTSFNQYPNLVDFLETLGVDVGNK